MAENYDPAKQPCDPLYHILPTENTLPLDGPGGLPPTSRTTRRASWRPISRASSSMHEYAVLGSDHDSSRMGIYATNSVGDRD